MNAAKKLLYDCLYLQDEIIATAISRRKELGEMIENFDDGLVFKTDENFLKKERERVKMCSKEWKKDPKVQKSRKTNIEDDRWGEL